VNQAEAVEAAKALPWAKWIALDFGEEWWVYSHKPVRMGNMFSRRMSCGEFMGDCVEIGRLERPSTDPIKVRR